MPKIVSTMKQSIVERFPVELPEGFDIVYAEQPINNKNIIEISKDADYLLVSAVHKIDRELIENISHIKLIQSYGVGYDKIDLEAARDHGIYVCNNRGVNGSTVAEIAVTLMSMCLHSLAQADVAIKSGKYDEAAKEYMQRGHHELSSRKVGLVGVGSIGMHVAKLLKAYGSKVYYTDIKRLDKNIEKEYDLEMIEFEKICKVCDIISFHVPVLDSTKGMVNKDMLSKLKKDSIIINISRGEIVNNDDLKEALENGNIYAGLDVISPEPPSSDHPLLNLNDEGNKRLTISPHIGGTADEAFTRMKEWSYKNMLRVSNGERPINIVNKM